MYQIPTPGVLVLIDIVSVPESEPPAGLNTGVATVPAGVLVEVEVPMVKLVLVAEVRPGWRRTGCTFQQRSREIAKGRNTILWRGG